MRLSVLLFFFTISSTGCFRPSSSSSPVIVLAVENLSPDDGVCSSDVRPGVQSGLDLFCSEFVKFESIRSPSKGAAPALGSFLNGLSPTQLKASTNDVPIPAELESAPEKFYTRGWITGFFGSSPVFMRRSGLAQGFETFEESLQADTQRWGRRSDQVIQSFLKWQTEIGKSPFYAVLTFSDLNFPWVRTSNLSGQERSRTVEGQVEAVVENGLTLFRALKERRIWDKAWVIVIGLQGRREDFNRFRVAGLVKPPKGVTAPSAKEKNYSLASFGRLIHQTIFGEPFNEPELDDEELGEGETDWPEGSFWLTSAGARQREEILRKRISEDPSFAPWVLYENLEQGKAKEFIQTASQTGLVDAAAFWDRLKSNQKTQILQDPCLRMIDLHIFEGGGSKTCDSVSLLALQEWMRNSEAGSDDARARQKTLRTVHELRTIRRIHMVNNALGRVLKLPLEIGSEILRTEMALRLPDQQNAKTWIDQNEPTITESSE